jgi:hypothetical protein
MTPPASVAGARTGSAARWRHVELERGVPRSARSRQPGLARGKTCRRLLRPTGHVRLIRNSLRSTTHRGMSAHQSAAHSMRGRNDGSSLQVVKDVGSREVCHAAQWVGTLPLQEEVADQRGGGVAMAEAPADGGQHHPVAERMSARSGEGRDRVRTVRDSLGALGDCGQECRARDGCGALGA